MTIVETERLIVRPWRDDDLAAFAALNADPAVMEHFPACLDRADSDALADRIRTVADLDSGIGFWAVEVPGVAPFIGFVGLRRVGPEMPFAPAVEIGWRLARAHWGHGYASEAARAMLDVGFRRCHLADIVAFTVPANARSQAVMRRLGMTRDANADFEHPALPAGHPLRRHVLYRLTAAAAGC